MKLVIIFLKGYKTTSLEYNKQTDNESFFLPSIEEELDTAYHGLKPKNKKVLKDLNYKFSPAYNLNKFTCNKKNNH